MLHIERKHEGYEVSDRVGMEIVSCLYVGYTKEDAMKNFAILLKYKKIKLGGR